MILLAVVLYTLAKKKFQNRYTRFAFVNLTIALTLRLFSCLMYAVKSHSEDLNTRLFDVLIF